MNKSPEFDMLKEPAEPESAQRRNRAKRAEKKGRKGVTTVMQRAIKSVSLKNQTGMLHTQQQQQQQHNITEA